MLEEVGGNMLCILNTHTKQANRETEKHLKSGTSSLSIAAAAAAAEAE